jgi:thioesterase domain-containing protein/acyl carrier protein
LVAALFGELFGLDSVAADDDFFALGGDSLLATGLIAGIERQFGVVLPVSALIEAPTPQALAEIIGRSEEGMAGRCLIAVNPEGKGPSLFCIHGMKGDIVVSRALSAALGSVRPVYAFRAAGLQGGENPGVSVPIIAANYVAELIERQPDGPPVIIGHCGGSMIAYEMAQQLTSAGHQVAGLILLDPFGRDYVAWLTSTGMEMHIRTERARRQAEAVVKRAAANPGMDSEQRRRIVEEALFAAVGSYLPEPYLGATLLVYSRGGETKFMNPKLGFPRFLPNLETAGVDEADHDALFSTRIEETAAHINRFLDRVAPI